MLVMLDNPIVLGIDYGDKYIGLATGHLVLKTATPLTTIQRPSSNQLPWEAIDKIISDWNPAVLVVGLPFNLDGSPSIFMKKLAYFTTKLSKRYDLLIHTIDERLSTREARSRLPSHHRSKQKLLLNQMAAQVILETYLSLLNQGSYYETI